MLLLPFIQETPPRNGRSNGIEEDQAETTLLDSLCAALNAEREGCLKVLRHGFKCFGKLFRAACFAPASGLNPGTQTRYKSDRLTVPDCLH